MASFGVAVSNDGTNEPLPQNHVYCRGCGKPIHKQAPACPKCGAPQSVTGTLPSGRKDRVTAALLAFFLGGFGGHKFYLGQTGMGIFYILFFWTFIPMIVSLIEGIIYLTMSDSEFSTKYI
jgi:TM2 domain-containing membrane protein YozV